MALTACATNMSYEPVVCGIPSGGISQIFIFDPTVFNFTQAAPVSGAPQSYTAITDAGTSDLIYPVKFEQMSAEYDFDFKSDNGVTLAYTHKLMFSVPRVDMIYAQWAQYINQNAYCCGIGIIIVTNSVVGVAPQILVMGEALVNNAKLIPVFYMFQNGTKGQTGKKGSDKNSVTTTIESCEYIRPLIQYTGTLASIEALAAA